MEASTIITVLQTIKLIQDIKKGDAEASDAVTSVAELVGADTDEAKEIVEIAQAIDTDFFESLIQGIFGWLFKK